MSRSCDVHTCHTICTTMASGPAVIFCMTTALTVFATIAGQLSKWIHLMLNYYGRMLHSIPTFCNFLHKCHKILKHANGREGPFYLGLTITKSKKNVQWQISYIQVLYRIGIIKLLYILLYIILFKRLINLTIIAYLKYAGLVRYNVRPNSMCTDGFIRTINPTHIPFVREFNK